MRGLWYCSEETGEEWEVNKLYCSGEASGEWEVYNIVQEKLREIEK